MAAKISSLIDKQDNNEIIRDKIAVILATEEANQRALATAGGKDPNNWKFDIYIERSNPWALLTHSEDGDQSDTPLVNVLFDNDVFDNRNSTQTERQRVKGTFFIDCYAHKAKTKNIAGDEATSKESDRIARLVRNIIMAAPYYQLDLGFADSSGYKIVYTRYILKREKFTPLDREGRAFENIIATRLTLEVEYDENSPQFTPVDIEELFVDCRKDEVTGQVYFEAEYDMTE